MGSSGFNPRSGAGDESLRRQHLLRRAGALRRVHLDHRRGNRHPQPRGRHRGQAPEDPHPAHPPPPRPHPGADVLRPLLPSRIPRSRSGGRRHRRRRSRSESPATSPRRSPRSRSASFPATCRSATRRRPSGRSARRRSAPRRSPTAGPTLGYRITDGDTTLSYIPDHEPALGRPARRRSSPSGSPAMTSPSDARLLLHDCQYTDDEYPDHVGWGHSRAADTLTFARRVERAEAAALPPRPAALRRLPRSAPRDRRRSAGRSSAAPTEPSRWRPRTASSSLGLASEFRGLVRPPDAGRPRDARPRAARRLRSVWPLHSGARPASPSVASRHP